MKKFYTLFLTTILLAMSASAQTTPRYTLADLITEGESGKFYTIDEDLLAVYVSEVYPNVIFAKDDNAYAAYSQPTEDQYNNGKLYDERNGYFDQWGDWYGTFDQSNWVKIVLPEGMSAEAYRGKYIKSRTLTGRVNIQNTPCGPMGLTLYVEDANNLPQIGSSETYTPNTYCTANFVKQDVWYLVKPQNQEFAKIHWAVYHQADKKFYVPAQNLAEGWNSANLAGSFPVDMSHYAPHPGIDPNEVYQDGYMYEFPALIEYRLGGTDFGLNIDPGFGNEHNIHFTPRKGMPAGNAGDTPFVTDDDNNVYYYRIMVYPLEESEGVITGVEQTVGVRSVESVRYSDLQGRLSATPHPGMNIVVTTYSDGSTTTRKTIW